MLRSIRPRCYVCGTSSLRDDWRTWTAEGQAEVGRALLADEDLRDRLDDEVQPVIHHSVADDQRIARQVEDQVEVAGIRVPVGGPLERRRLDLRDEVEDGVRLCVAQRRNLSLDD